MADYYPLIARAIAGLDPSAPGESRRALYERARAALIAQLRSVEPPLSESEITRERLSLEEAVRKVESEAAQRAREALAPGGARPRRSRPRRRCVPRHHPAHAAAGRRRRRRRRQPSLRHSRLLAAASACAAARATTGRRSARTIRARSATFAAMRRRRAAPPPPVPPQDPPLPPTRERTGVARRGADNGAPQAPGVRGFRDIAADADDLGRAAAQATRVGAEDLCQRAVAIAGVRPLRAEHGEPRRRSGRRPIRMTNRSRRPSATRRRPAVASAR